jgi:hypothetical protein
MRLAKVVALALLVSSAAFAWCEAQEKDREKEKAVACPCCSPEGRHAHDQLEQARVALTKLPMNPFADVKPGDWWLYSVKVISGEKPVAHYSLVWKVEELDGDDVRISETVVGEGKPWLDHGRWFSRQDAPALLAFCHREGPANQKVAASSEPRFSEDKRSVSGEDFSTKRVSWIEVLDEPHAPLSWSIWMSPDARSSVVALQCKKAGADDGKLSLELAGYGSAGKADWGKAP